MLLRTHAGKAASEGECDTGGRAEPLRPSACSLLHFVRRLFVRPLSISAAIRAGGAAPRSRADRSGGGESEPSAAAASLPVLVLRDELGADTDTDAAALCDGADPPLVR